MPVCFYCFVDISLYLNYRVKPFIRLKKKKLFFFNHNPPQGEDGSHMGSQRLKDIECELGEQKKSTAKITKLCLAAIKVGSMGSSMKE